MVAERKGKSEFPCFGFVDFECSCIIVHLSLFSYLQDWLAFNKLRIENFTLTESLDFTNNNSPSRQDNGAFCLVSFICACREKYKKTPITKTSTTAFMQLNHIKFC